jgi:branched-subunit amino acid aminotransferase/4-amino-4-deoxychorismate lyase
LDKNEVKWVILAFARRLGKGPYKVRLLVDANGKTKIAETGLVPVSSRQDTCRGSSRAAPIKASPEPKWFGARRPHGASLREPSRVAVSKIAMNSKDLFLRHKTTRREVYDREYAKYMKKGFADVIFFNERGEVTEAHSSNVFIKKGGKFYTPPVTSGLLPGTYRQYLLDKGEKYSEKVLHLKDLKKADEIYICNSVRGLRRVYL